MYESVTLQLVSLWQLGKLCLVREGGNPRTREIRVQYEIAISTEYFSQKNSLVGQ